MKSLFPAITILKSQAFDLIVQHHKVENPDNSVIEKHKYLIDSIDSAIKILETKHRKVIKKRKN